MLLRDEVSALSAEPLLENTGAEVRFFRMIAGSAKSRSSHRKIRRIRARNSISSIYAGARHGPRLCREGNRNDLEV